MKSLSLLFGLGAVSAHMEMKYPVTRKSKLNKFYTGDEIDYDMTAPLGDIYPFPCRGYKAGPVSDTYSAGDSISVQLDGGASHNGGHCQWSLSYNDVDFAVIKTVMGTCMVDTNNYQVQIPKDAPEGKVTLAWSWINRSGNREYYMNCADIYIKGSPNGHVVGSKMLVADLPGLFEFPEGFANDYGSDLYAKQPTITISPSGGSAYPTSSPSSSSSAHITSSIPSSSPIYEASSAPSSADYPTSAIPSSAAYQASTVLPPVYPTSAAPSSPDYQTSAIASSSNYQNSAVYQTSTVPLPVYPTSSAPSSSVYITSSAPIYPTDSQVIEPSFSSSPVSTTPETVYSTNSVQFPTSTSLPHKCKPKSKPTQVSSQYSESCQDGEMVCQGTQAISKCYLSTLYPTDCPLGTSCKVFEGYSRCM